MVFETKLLGEKELWAHPPERPTLQERVRACDARGVRCDREQTKVRKTGVASAIDEYILLLKEIRQGVRNSWP